MCTNFNAFVMALCGVALLAPACRRPRQEPVVGLPTLAERGERVQALDVQRQGFETRQRQRAGSPVSGFVLIPHDVMLYASEEEARSSDAHLPTPRDLGSFPTSFDVSAYRVVEDLGDVVHVRFMSASELVFHCVDAPVHSLTSRMTLSAWIPKLSLLPVLTETFVRQFEDKSAYGFLPGSPAWPARQTPDVSHVLDARGFQVAVGASRDTPLALALSYGEPGVPTNLKADELSVPLDVMLWVNREPVMRADELSPLMRRIVQQREHDSQTMMVALGDACMQVAALAPRSDVVRAVSEQLPPVMLLGDTGSGPSAAQSGVEHTLFWPDGREAGKLFHRIPSLPGLDNEQVSQRTGMRCVDVPLGLSAPLCIKEVTP